jgi:hypothetical protein
MLVTLNEASIETGDDLISIALRLGQQNPLSPSVIPSLPLPLPQSLQSFEQSSLMAFQRADPRPFAPPGFHQHEVQNRTAMARAVIRPPPCIHEDYAIVSIDPLSTNPL